MKYYLNLKSPVQLNAEKAKDGNVFECLCFGYKEVLGNGAESIEDFVEKIFVAMGSNIGLIDTFLQQTWTLINVYGGERVSHDLGLLISEGLPVTVDTSGLEECKKKIK